MFQHIKHDFDARSGTIALQRPCWRELKIRTHEQNRSSGGDRKHKQNPPPGKPKRGRLKRSKARNLLERLKDYEDDVLRFMENPDVPFTNNRGENDIRMTKVQQKISGCFRSMTGAMMSCRIRGYLSSCRKQGMSATQAMSLVFEGKLPAFALPDELR